MSSLVLKNFTRGLLKLNRALGKHARPIDQIVCIDIECTCDSPVQIYPLELIEIACLRVDLTSIKNTSKNTHGQSSNYNMFHSYVKPIENPQLTPFCQELTGIMQPTVDDADTVEKVFSNWMDWMKSEDLIDDNLEKKQDFAFASCGNFDIHTLSPELISFFNMDGDLPIYFKEWINVKRTFVSHKNVWPKGLLNMLALLNLEPSGRLHSAKDDCKNLARVIECLHHNGCKFKINSRM